MKKLLFLLPLYLLFSCKSPEEKFKEKVIVNSKYFLERLNNSKINKLTIEKIDTVTDYKELLTISGLLKDAAYYKRINYAGIHDPRIVNDIDMLEFKAKEFYNIALKNRDKKRVNGYFVEIKYSSKDNLGSVSDKEISLPFFIDGEIQNINNYAQSLFKKHKIEHLLTLMN